MWSKDVGLFLRFKNWFGKYKVWRRGSWHSCSWSSWTFTSGPLLWELKFHQSYCRHLPRCLQPTGRKVSLPAMKLKSAWMLFEDVKSLVFNLLTEKPWVFPQKDFLKLFCFLFQKSNNVFIFLKKTKLLGFTFKKSQFFIFRKDKNIFLLKWQKNVKTHVTCDSHFFRILFITKNYSN